MYEELANNRVTLSGEVISTPVFSHEVYGEGFYEFLLKVMRLSNQSDLLPLTVSERLLGERRIGLGDMVTIEGQFRSYNKMSETHSRLMLTVFVRSLEPFDQEINPNIIELEGYLCKPPMYRTTPFKREICDLLLAVNRAYNKSDYIPCIAWGRNARYVNTMQVGQHIALSGRIQSRQYVKQISDTEQQTRTAYEVSVARITMLDEAQQKSTSDLVAAISADL